jgi:hypothetical protein
MFTTTDLQNKFDGYASGELLRAKTDLSLNDDDGSTCTCCVVYRHDKSYRSFEYDLHFFVNALRALQRSGAIFPPIRWYKGQIFQPILEGDFVRLATRCVDEIGQGVTLGFRGKYIAGLGTPPDSLYQVLVAEFEHEYVALFSARAVYGE